jgi:phosphate starvation-inducible PhoH-like protein
MNPYLRPLYDAMYDILGVETVQKYMDSNIIEVAPLAYMRGRTLDDCFIILDEAQNTTPEQMKMFLTRFGYGSRIVVTGDVTQIDLGQGKVSGLKQVIKILNDIEGIEFVNLSHKDVVRHKLVMQIIRAYEKFDKENEDR